VSDEGHNRPIYQAPRVDERSVIRHFSTRRRVTPSADAPYALRVSEDRTFHYHRIFRGQSALCAILNRIASAARFILNLCAPAKAQCNRQGMALARDILG
jgi:hypothetical protein